MPILVSCPDCKTTLNAPDTTAGRRVRCPNCGTTFAVPEQELPLARMADPPPLRRRERPPAFDDDYDPRGEYDDSEDQYYPRRRYYRREPEGPGAGLQLGMGVAGLSVGGAGLIIGMMPCIGFLPGLVAGGIGAVLSLVGLVVALTHKGEGVAFPIAGLATSIVAVLVTIAVYHWVYTQYQRRFWFGQVQPDVPRLHEHVRVIPCEGRPGGAA
jgi:predicted Zn finger-like uncharacterized protein